jgi:hypothetical protein
LILKLVALRHEIDALLMDGGVVVCVVEKQGSLATAVDENGLRAT